MNSEKGQGLTRAAALVDGKTPDELWARVWATPSVVEVWASSGEDEAGRLSRPRKENARRRGSEPQSGTTCVMRRQQRWADCEAPRVAARDSRPRTDDG